MRSTLIRAVLVAVLSITTTIGLMSSVVATASTPVTATTELNVRAKPSTTAKIVGSLHRGQTVKSTSDSNGWTKITYKGKTAYVSSRYVTQGAEVPTGDDVGKGETRTTTTQVNLREGPGLTEDVITVLDEGTEVVQTGNTSKGWTEVTVDSDKGWVSTQYLTGTGDGLPEVTGTRTTTMDLNVRATSDADGKVIGLAEKGTKVSITGTTENARSQVVFKGKVGWVLAKYLSNGDTDEPTAPPLPAVTGSRYATADLTIRTTSGSDFTDLGDIPEGTKISITGVQENSRAQIIWDGAVRWVTAKYLTKTKPSSSGASPGVEKGLKPNALKVLAAVRKNWPQIKTIGGVHPDPLPDHPSGRALDLMLPSYKSAAGKKLGHDLSRWLEARHTELGINYIIYDQHIWNEQRDREGWRPMAGRGSDSANHKNHVHVTVLAKGYSPI
ncbi:MAG: SH3 domain-containing protein [Janthinobacterium lividum]